MRIFVAGATGVLGQRLVPLLGERGHEVTAMTRDPRRAEALAASGVRIAVADGLDAEAVMRAVGDTEPEVVIHQMTSLSRSFDVRHLERTFAATNLLRTDGTRHLLAAARAAGTRRFIAQSFAGWPYARIGGPVKTEEDPLDPDPPAGLRAPLEAIRTLEGLVTGAQHVEGVVLRYGGFYGPGTSVGEGGQQVEAVRRRRFPVVGSGAGVWSFLHVDDGASATAAAVEAGEPGLYTSSTTSRRRFVIGCPRSPRRWERSRPGTCRPGSGDSPWAATDSCG